MPIERIEPLDVIDSSIDKKVSQINVCLPAYIVSQTDGQKVTVQPVLRGNKLDSDGNPESFLPPQIQNVPIIWPQAGGLSLTFPLKTSSAHGADNADWVLLVFGDRSMEEWLSYGNKDIEPKSKRRHHITDAVAYAGIRPFNNLLQSVPQDRLRMGQHVSSNPTRIEVTQTGGGGGSTGYIRIGNDSSELLDLFEQLLAKIQTSFVNTGIGVQQILVDGGASTLNTIASGISDDLDLIREP